MKAQSQKAVVQWRFRGQAEIDLGLSQASRVSYWDRSNVFHNHSKLSEGDVSFHLKSFYDKRSEKDFSVFLSIKYNGKNYSWDYETVIFAMFFHNSNQWLTNVYIN